MSSLNQKGPMGVGPMTGRKMGRCGNFGGGRRYPTTQENDNPENSVTNNPKGQGLRRGQGRGKGLRNGMTQGRSGGMSQNRGGCGMGRSGAGCGRGMGRRFRDIQE